MIDILEEFTGDTPMRAGLVKKRAKVQERLDKLSAKAEPLVTEIAMYDEMIGAIDKRAGILSDSQNADPA